MRCPPGTGRPPVDGGEPARRRGIEAREGEAVEADLVVDDCREALLRPQDRGGTARDPPEGACRAGATSGPGRTSRPGCTSRAGGTGRSGRALRASGQLAGLKVGRLERTVLDVHTLHGRVDDLRRADRVLRDGDSGVARASQGDDQSQRGGDVCVAPVLEKHDPSAFVGCLIRECTSIGDRVIGTRACPVIGQALGRGARSRSRPR